jgi:hypothetical protein
MPVAEPTRTGLHRWTRVALLLLGWLLGAWGSTAALAQPLADPRVDWLSADSAHFRVHYRSTQRAQALAVARAAERVYPRVTKLLEWEPRSRTEIVLYSEFDIANGFSTPLPYNFMGIFLAPPDEGELLNNSAWIDLLLVHEFTHAVHLDKVRGVPGVLQRIFGNVPWFIPNVFQPGWMLEGLAVWSESEPALGRGRLKSPAFEAWLRAERASGFLSLAEINADGRALPLNKQYLYGAYFMDFMARRYGADKITALVHQYSGNIVPRLHSAPFGATGKMMDELWVEFLADLTQQVDARSAALRAQPEAVGAALGGPWFDVSSVTALPATAGGGWLAVVEDGENGTQLMRWAADGSRQRLMRLNRGARVEAAADGSVLVTQPDVCNTLNLAYDLYRLREGRLQQLTHCARLRRAVPTGAAVLALQVDEGRTQLVQLDGEGRNPRVLLAAVPGTDLTELAAAPDGRSVSVVSHRGGDWQLQQIDLAQPQAAARLLLRRAAPISGLRHGPAGIEFITAEAGVTNVWRLAGGELQRLTHSHTSVVAHAGTAADGSLLSVVIAPKGYTLHRLAQPLVLQTLAAPSAAALPQAAADPAPEAAALGEGRSYSALRALRPRSWLPAAVADHGLTAYGASTTGGDALGWHRYAALAMWETSQKELVGSFEYQFVGSHGLAIQRDLTAQSWTTREDKDTVSVYDRRTRLQWLSLFPFSRLERRVHLGVGAAGDWTDRVDLSARSTTRRRDERLLAALVDVDWSNGDWFSEGTNRGAQASLLVESYKPLSGGDARRFDGTVVRADLRAYLGTGALVRRSVLALRYTEARARDRTEPFQLGGATDEVLQLGPALNERQLSLRGYRGDESGLRGTAARVGSVEWRLPLADIDRHAMVPAVGINRLSATVFFDMGGAWSSGNGPASWSRGVGIELLGEVKLLYALGLQLRVGVAQALDGPRDTRGYLTAGRSF